VSDRDNDNNINSKNNAYVANFISSSMQKLSVEVRQTLRGVRDTSPVAQSRGKVPVWDKAPSS